MGKVVFIKMLVVLDILFISFTIWHIINAQFYIMSNVYGLENCKTYEQRNVFLQTECIITCQRQNMIPIIHNDTCYCAEQTCQISGNSENGDDNERFETFEKMMREVKNVII